MHRRFLQSMIHSEKSTDRTIWDEYYGQVSASFYEDFIEGQLPPGDFTDHLGREFNRRVYNLGFYDLLIVSWDAGFRIIP